MSLKGKNILIFVADEYEDLELQYPKLRMIEAGAKVVIAGAEKKEYKGKHGYPCKDHVLIDSINPDEFHAIIIPGGHAPDKLRTIPKVIEIVQKFHKERKLIAFICHGGWVPISAKILDGYKCTSYIAIKDDMINAKANWVDAECVQDRNLISSRKPDDLPQFCAAIIKNLEAIS